MRYLAHDYQQTAVVATLHLEKVRFHGFTIWPARTKGVISLA